MDGWMDAWMDQRMDRRMDEWMDWMDGWMHERIDRCLDVWMDVTFAARLTSCLPLPFGSHREDHEDNEEASYLQRLQKMF